MAKKYMNLGVMKLAKKKNPGDEDEPKRYYLQLEQQKGKDGKPYGDQIFPIKLANGVVLNDGDILSLYSKREKFNRLVEAGKMDAEKADQLASFLLFDLVLARDEDEQSKSDDEIDF